MAFLASQGERTDDDDDDDPHTSIFRMLHFGGEYTGGCPTTIRGIEVNTYKGVWNISEWDALLDVKYYWSSE